MNQFSIIIPVYNGGRYLKECVASILAQTYPHFSLVLLESQSSDGTEKWLPTITDPRVKVYYSDTRLSITQNWGRILTVAKAPFMTICGQDDLLLPHYLEEMDCLIRQYPDASLYQTHFSFIDKHGAFIRDCLPMPEKQDAYSLLEGLLTKTFDSMATGYLFRSEDYEQIGGISHRYPDLLFADNELWIKLTALHYKATAARNCFSYRYHQSLSRTTGGMNYYRSFDQYNHFLKSLADNDPQMKKIIQQHILPFLYENCETVAHRLLKTPVAEREIQVRRFIEQCREYAGWLAPGQPFNPLQQKRIWLAAWMDDFALTRNAFQYFRKKYRGRL